MSQERETRQRGPAGWRREERWVLLACVAMAGLEVSVLYAFAALVARSMGL